jgi:predicted DNA-binding antitoxin AbrB/MazE fold protein
MTVVGKAHYERGVIIVDSPLELPEGARLLIVRIDGILALVPENGASDNDFTQTVEDSIREHYETLKALAL